MFEIPTFEVGGRVRVHYRNYEFFCPECGKPQHLDPDLPETELATIHSPTKYVSNKEVCEHVFPWPEGFYKITDDKGGHMAVPYTLLEKLEDS